MHLTTREAHQITVLMIAGMSDLESVSDHSDDDGATFTKDALKAGHNVLSTKHKPEYAHAHKHTHTLSHTHT